MRVFISSTYRDLLPERRALTWVVQELRATFVGMEIFSAAQESLTDAAIREISECDVVVFVIAHRYGSLARASKKSILEREYETACSQKKHIFIYVKDEGACVHVAGIEFENRRKLERFKAKLSKRHLFGRYTTPDQLAGLVAIDLMRFLLNQGFWYDVPREMFERYRAFWKPAIDSETKTAVIMEVGEGHIAHRGELEYAKNINGVRGVLKLLHRRCTGTPAMTLEAWIDSVQTRGRYTFLRAEAIKESGLSAEAVKKALQRLVRRRRVAKVKNYFYVIAPLSGYFGECRIGFTMSSGRSDRSAARFSSPRPCRPTPSTISVPITAATRRFSAWPTGFLFSAAAAPRAPMPA